VKKIKVEFDDEIIEWLLQYAMSKKKNTEYVLEYKKPKNKENLIRAIEMWDKIIDAIIDAKAEHSPNIGNIGIG